MPLEPIVPDHAPTFAPTLAAARARLAAVRPAEYACSRNAINGAVTRLSPYLTHGVLTLPEVLADVASRHRIGVQHKFVFELGWREYFRHVWRHRGDAILRSLHGGPLPDDAYADGVPADIREARTGVPAIDAAVRSLYATGYLHNHARMWLASYVVHLRKVHWRAGADWLYGHLLDGDLASNHLSWQWVAGTGSSKPYLFNADNVARYAPPDWHSPGTVIDASYEALDAIARRALDVGAGAGGEGLREPLPRSRPSPQAAALAPEPGRLRGRDVWLVHPWALRAPPPDLEPGTLRLGVYASDFHRERPWAAARWGFVESRMAASTELCWLADAAVLAGALRTARSVRGVADPHLPAVLASVAALDAPPRLFAEPGRPFASFSSWWARVTRGVDGVHDLPGLAALSAGPLFDARAGLGTAGAAMGN